MKTTVVPAQITSVEDRISAHLSFKQLILMIIPVFLSAAIFVFLPPFLMYRNYKLAISLVFVALCLTLAIRIKQRLIIEWIQVLKKYNSRPRIYVYNKNSMIHRSRTKMSKIVTPEVVTEVEASQAVPPEYKEDDVVNFESIVDNPLANFHFSRSKKGGLSVHLKEIR